MTTNFINKLPIELIHAISEFVYDDQHILINLMKVSKESLDIIINQYPHIIKLFKFVINRDAEIPSYLAPFVKNVSIIGNDNFKVVNRDLLKSLVNVNHITFENVIIKHDAVSHLHKIEKITVKNMEDCRFLQDFHSKTVKSLDVEYSAIEHEEVNHFKNIEKLRLAYWNSVPWFPIDVNSLSKLKELTIMDLDETEIDYFSNNSIKSLTTNTVLDRNDLRLFMKMKSLTHIQIDRNSIMIPKSLHDELVDRFDEIKEL